MLSSPAVALSDPTPIRRSRSMKHMRVGSFMLAVAVAFAAGQMLAQQASRTVPAHELAAPDTVSPAMKAVIGAPLSPIWNEHPKSASEWKTFIGDRAVQAAAALPDLQKRLGVKVEPTVIGG